ncbi:MAG: response regulator [Candidatus Latescibacterota bacterium]|nr:response regulator [Candidatus Latescibacterota bacterium]
MASVLLAGDDARTRVGISRALSKAGHGVLQVNHIGLASQAADETSTPSSSAFLQHFRSEKFIEAIRARDGDTPIVALTESLAAWRSDRLENLGVRAMLAKPFRVDELVGLIERLACPEQT